jgi:hypothetical protein
MHGKNTLFIQYFSFPGKYPLLSFTKTIHSKFRRNLLLKTDFFLQKWRNFFCFLNFFPFERINLASVGKKLLGKLNESATLRKKSNFIHFFNAVCVLQHCLFPHLKKKACRTLRHFSSNFDL